MHNFTFIRVITYFPIQCCCLDSISKSESSCYKCDKWYHLMPKMKKHMTIKHDVVYILFWKVKVCVMNVTTHSKRYLSFKTTCWYHKRFNEMIVIITWARSSDRKGSLIASFHLVQSHPAAKDPGDYNL